MEVYAIKSEHLIFFEKTDVDLVLYIRLRYSRQKTNTEFH